MTITECPSLQHQLPLAWRRCNEAHLGKVVEFTKQSRSHWAIFQGDLRTANCEKVVSWRHDVTAMTDKAEKPAKAGEENPLGSVPKPTCLHSRPRPPRYPTDLASSAMLVRLTACVIGSHDIFWAAGCLI